MTSKKALCAILKCTKRTGMRLHSMIFYHHYCTDKSHTYGSTLYRIYCPRKDKVRMCILQFCHFTIKYTEICSNLIFLNKMPTHINALIYTVCVGSTVLYKNIESLRISVYFIVKWQNCKTHIRTLSL